MSPSIGYGRGLPEERAYHRSVSEIGDVLAAIEALSAKGERMALATIVAVRGSTYRRPGARLLVPEDGAPVGNLSGGCLEGDVADMARVVMSEGRARLAGWDLTADDDAVWGLGLGCNGAIEVFIEPAEKAAEVAGALRAALEEERPISVITVVESSRPDVEPGARLVVRPGGATRRVPRGTRSIDEVAVGAAEELLRSGALRGPRPDRPGPSVRRGAGSAAPTARVRRRTRCDPARPSRLGARMERDGRRRSTCVPDPRSLPRSGGLRHGRGPGRRRQGGGRGRTNVRRRDDPPLPPRQGVRPLDARVAGRLHRDARPRQPGRSAC